MKRLVYWALALIALTFAVSFPLNEFVLSSSVKDALGFLVLSSSILLVAGVIFIFGFPKRSTGLRRAISKDAIGLSFLVALTSMLGSLFYSEILYYTPCILCWYQRILMYPLVLILGSALVLKRKNVRWVVVPMVVLGALIAGYHYLTQMIDGFKIISTNCLAQGGVDCATKLTLSFGYITIPMMAFMGFILILALVSNRK